MIDAKKTFRTVLVSLIAVTIVGSGTAANAAVPSRGGDRFVSSLTEEFTGNSTKSAVLRDGDTFGKWRVVYSGSLSGLSGPYVKDGYLTLNPDYVSDPATTNATLVVSQASFTGANLRIESTWVTTAQTRQNSPANPWETGWLVWDYVDPEHFTYLVLKPNGWEIGRRDPAYAGGQRFIATGETLLTPIGQVRTAVVTRTGIDSTVTVDGVPLVSFQVQEGETVGAVGLYVEDATAKFDRIRVDSN